MKEEANHLQVVIDTLHDKHKEYADMIQSYSSTHSVDQAEIKKISGFMRFHYHISFPFLKNYNIL